MKIGKIVSIVVVCLAAVIILGAAAAAFVVFGFKKNAEQQNFEPPQGQQAASPSGNILLFSQASGSSSFLFRQDGTGGAKARLTHAASGIESEASFSHDGKSVVYSFAESPDSQSSIWVVGADGSNPHLLSEKNQDALHPVFSPDDAKVFYAVSNFTGHYSPIVRPARHQWDVFSISTHSNGATPDSASAQITHSSFYDLQSVDVFGDDQGGTKLLISTTGYPIGALIEEFYLSDPGRDKIFQPHVPGEPSGVGPSYGQSRFVHNGMDILFLAATNTTGGNYDYNVFSMSEVTGAEIKQLTHLRGMTKDLRILPSDKAIFWNGGVIYLLDINTGTSKPL
jgi:hypothetical protein